MGKANELGDDLLSHPLTPEERAAKYPKVPELRLRADAPAAEVDENTRVQEVVKRLQSEAAPIIALRDMATGATAVVMPVERYLQLVGTELVNDPLNQVGGLEGHIAPTDAALRASHIEQVNPSETWKPSGKID